MRRIGMKKIVVLTLSLLAFTLLAACAGTPLNEEYFTEKEVYEKAEMIIDLAFADDYDTIWEYYHDEAKEKVSKETFIEDMSGYLDAAGEFKQFSGSMVEGYEHEEREGEFYAIATYVAECQNTTVQFVVYFNDQMELAGLVINLSE